MYGKSFKNSTIGKRQIVGILQETTESRFSRDKLAQAVTVFNYASEGIIVLNKDRRFIDANNAFYNITCFQAGNLKNKELSLLSKYSLDEKLIIISGNPLINIVIGKEE